VFISYRRQDRGFAGRLFDQLKRTFGADRVFMDVDSIVPGRNFRTAIVGAINRSAVLLVVIGPHWSDITDEDGSRRLDNADDPVRVEIETAIAQKIVVIPVLLDGTPMPDARVLPCTIQELTQSQAIGLRHDSFSSDFERLLPVLSGHVDPGPLPSAGDRRRGTRPLVVTLAVLAVLAVAGVVWLTVNSGQPVGPSAEVAEFRAPSADEHVWNPVDVQGTAQIPAGRALWVLILAPDTRFYLTTDGPVTVDADGRWATRLTAGNGSGPDDIAFSLLAVSAPASTSTLDDKVASKKATGGSGGGFDALPEDAVPLDRLDLHLSAG
jgi:hypothetical protein